MTQPQQPTDNLWEQIRSLATYAGRELVEKSLMLFFAAQRPETPLWAKTVIYSALAYFILPTDAIPDFIPVSGYVDDLGTLAAALGAVGMNITPQVQADAKQKVNEWFGNPDTTTEPSGTPQSGDSIREISIDD
jgi:uncharacterized membrane protein YkvA (DUF1232 family)